MTERHPLPPWLDPFELDRQLGGIGAASNEMMIAWLKAWQANLTGRAMPALSLLLNPGGACAQASADALQALEGWLGTPQWSDFVSLDSDTLRSFAPALELAQVGQAYALETTRVCGEICQEFQKRLAASGLKVDGSGEALDLWNATVDETLMRYHKSEAFADLQRRFLRALMAFRLEQRRVVQRASEHYDIPTRTEIDELARRVHELERECRRLRRQVATGPSPVPTGASDDPG